MCVCVCVWMCYGGGYYLEPPSTRPSPSAAIYSARVTYPSDQFCEKNNTSPRIHLEKRGGLLAGDDVRERGHGEEGRDANAGLGDE